MKTKKIITLLTVITVTSVYFIGCKRNDTLKDGGLNFGPQATGTPTSLNFVEEQLRWIARGYAEVLDIHDPAMLSFLNTHLSNKTDYQDDHLSIKNQCQGQLSIDLEDEVYNSVQRVPFFNNEYDRDYFYDFLFEDCNWSVGLRIVDTPDLSKPVVISYETFSGSDSSWGYFWNSGLDSVLLSSENFEDYYVLLVFAQNNCPINSMRNEGCNDNGICERLQGETEANCEDCRGTIQSNEKSLKIVWVRINEDKSMFDEAWGQNKYELGWDWCIADGTNGIIQHYRPNQDFDIYNGPFDKWKRRQVPVKRKSNGALKGTATQKSYLNQGIKTLYNKYDSAVHDIYMHFWEDDRHGDLNTDQIKDQNGNVITFANSFDGNWSNRTKGGTFHKGGGFDFEGLIFIPKNSVWTYEIIDGKPHMSIEAKTPGLEEITVKLAFER